LHPNASKATNITRIILLLNPVLKMGEIIEMEYIFIFILLNLDLSRF
jgi:hypothetical protein